jgi:hypothetical protein
VVYQEILKNSMYGLKEHKITCAGD